MKQPDPIAVAVVQNRLDNISQQMGLVMLRTARSPIFSHAHDFSCFITDSNGSVVSQADGIPIHTGGGGFAIRALLQSYRSDLAADDVFVLSDPYEAGGNHLPDWVIARPVFHEQRLVAFTCNRAHQSDIGGGAAGTYNPTATEIFHEGIR
ncbi:MAG TPA: hydantoinase B/oxoprolinase family protein, partial [Burkholderiaceae bacterium]|nr:hydantoinase B/oxoprolinase family protein [Burkholderiaceae bacterium]